jgi:pullulanase-type alpha-1,6-glucosidase
MAIYELHVRDFSINDASVRPAWRGGYLAFTEAASAGMQHLRALSGAGITDVHLLPVFDLATVPEAGCTSPDPVALAAAAPAADTQQALVMAGAAGDCFNWGYDPWHFTAPEGSYATSTDDGAVRVREFRAMVLALHRAGLRVGMDMVYNHTSASGQDPRSVLDRIVPGYYHRLNASGDVERSTCCDNTATEHRMMAKLMIDSAVVWTRDHRIDSLRFDLMGHQPRAAMERLQKAVNTASGRHIALIGEGWNFGEVQDGKRFVQASQLSLNGSGIGTFSDRARDAVRGGGAGDSGAALAQRQGWVNGLHFDANPAARAAAAEAKTTAEQDTRSALLRAADLVRVGLAGSLRGFRLQTHDDTLQPLERINYAGQPAGYASQPSEVVNYVENHDNLTLFDSNVFKLPPGTRSSDRARVQVLALATTAFSQGTAYFHAGVELLRSKSLDRNSYDSGDWFNRLDWTLQDNFFGTGLPPKADNGQTWPLMAPLLADAATKPEPADIRFTRDAFMDLLKIRASSTLFRLRTAGDVNARLHFHNTGANQEPTVVLARLDGRGLPGAGFAEVLYAINADTRAHTLRLPELAGRAYELHPVHRAAGAADPRPAALSRWTPASGQLQVPPRTALVYVLR